VKSLEDSSTLKNAFQVITTEEKSFTVYVETSVEKQEWLKNLEELTGPHDLLQSAPVWVPDSTTKHCLLCQRVFNMVQRRHHCRYCGKVVCGACSNRKLRISYIESKPVRVCRPCYEENKGNESVNNERRDREDGSIIEENDIDLEEYTSSNSDNSSPHSSTLLLSSTFSASSSSGGQEIVSSLPVSVGSGTDSIRKNRATLDRSASANRFATSASGQTGSAPVLSSSNWLPSHYSTTTLLSSQVPNSSTIITNRTSAGDPMATSSSSISSSDSTLSSSSTTTLATSSTTTLATSSTSLHASSKPTLTKPSIPPKRSPIHDNSSTALSNISIGSSTATVSPVISATVSPVISATATSAATLSSSSTPPPPPTTTPTTTVFTLEELSKKICLLTEFIERERNERNYLERKLREEIAQLRAELQAWKSQEK